MEDFLNGRETVTRTSSGTVNAGSVPNLPPLSRGDPSPEPAALNFSSHAETGAHGTRVETVVERGRVTRLIVTCTCGTVTEIECRY